MRAAEEIEQVAPQPGVRRSASTGTPAKPELWARAMRLVYGDQAAVIDLRDAPEPDHKEIAAEPAHRPAGPRPAAPTPNSAEVPVRATVQIDVDPSAHLSLTLFEGAGGAYEVHVGERPARRRAGALSIELPVGVRRLRFKVDGAAPHSQG